MYGENSTDIIESFKLTRPVNHHISTDLVVIGLLGRVVDVEFDKFSSQCIFVIIFGICVVSFLDQCKILSWYFLKESPDS